MMNGQRKEIKKIILMESINQLEQLENVDTFMATIQSTKQMRRYLKIDEVQAQRL